MKKIWNGISKYFKGVKKEVGRIRWVSMKELGKSTGMTVGFVVFLGLFFYVIDMLISLVRSVL